ncbi:MAG: cytochrome c3 family protein [Planctomycetes bacterium]|nr:cytochrome c3 family protein [Planctomycetota bacterium]
MVVVCTAVPLLAAGVQIPHLITAASDSSTLPTRGPDSRIADGSMSEDVTDNPFRAAFHQAMRSHIQGTAGLLDDGNDQPQQPETVALSTLSRFFSTVQFDHEIHADMSLMSGGCGNCHHDPSAEDGVRIAACRECHVSDSRNATLEQPSLKGAFHRQCLGCHRDWTHDNACGFCHREVDDLTTTHSTADATDIVGVAHPSIKAQAVYSYETSYVPAPGVTFHHLEHVTSFQLKCVDCHRSGSCDRCHDASLVREPVAHAQDCNSCHARNGCEFCHTAESRPSFDHESRTGWSLEPSHSKLTCTKCHGEVTSFVSPSTDCRGCHDRLDPEGFDHAVTGVVLSGSHAHYECSRCHQGNRLSTPASCSKCHADKSYPAFMPGDDKVVDGGQQ